MRVHLAFDASLEIDQALQVASLNFVDGLATALLRAEGDPPNPFVLPAIFAVAAAP